MNWKITVLIGRAKMKKLGLVLATVILLLVSLVGCSRQPGYGTIRVHVVSDYSTPLSGAKVVSNSQPGSQLKVTGITDTDGVVVFEDLEAGWYQFTVSRFNYEQRDVSITVEAGKTTEPTVTLNKPPESTSPTS